MAEARPKEILPVELAALVDVAECPRAENWSLRAALTRYAQPQPMRVSRLLDPVRRLEAALAQHTDLLRRHGPALWAALEAGDDAVDGLDDSALVLALLRTAAEIDRVGDLLAEWAVSRSTPRPDDAVDAVTVEMNDRLDALGVAREERLPPAARRRG